MKTTGAPSLTRQLLIGTGVPMAVIIALIGLMGYVTARGEINEVYDSQLAISAESLLRVAAGQTGTAAATATPTGLDEAQRDGVDEYARWHSFRVWRDGRPLLASANAPAGAPRAPGYATVQAGANWRVFTLVHGRYIVETRENTLARGEEITNIVWGLILPLALILPVIAFVLWFGVRRGLSGARRFAAAVAERSPGDLSRIDTQTPRELAPLADAVNALLAKLETSLDQERAFTDNAAHELRTPLAVIKAQAEVVAGARDTAERDTAVAELHLGVNRATRLMEQLLTLARLRHAPPQTAALNLMDQAREAIKDVYAAIARKGIELRLNGDETATAVADPALLHLILRNLLENAGKYAPVASKVDITVSAHDIIVRDRGPGIAEAERDKVFARFYRVKGSTEPGSGLGLSIVRTAAQQLGCRIELFTPPQTPDDNTGLGVRIVFAS